MKEKYINNIRPNRSFHFWNSINFLIVILIIAMLILKFVSRTNLIEITKISRLIYNWLAFTSGFICMIYFICLRKKCGKLKGDVIWLIIGLWLVLKGILIHFSIKYFGLDAFPYEVYVFIHAICLLFLISFLSINVMIYVNCFLKQKQNVNYIIIHGAKVGSKIMNNRIEVAADYMFQNNDTVAVASGGQGKDEKMSEADYIMKKLKKEGIKNSHIILEDKSTTTYENLLYSKKQMKQNASFIVVTDDYHILRARLIAKKVFGYMPGGLPVHSSKVSLPYYILREYFSLIHNSLKGNII